MTSDSKRTIDAYNKQIEILKDNVKTAKQNYDTVCLPLSIVVFPAQFLLSTQALVDAKAALQKANNDRATAMQDAQQKLMNATNDANDAIRNAQNNVKNAEDKMNRDFGTHNDMILNQYVY